MQPPPDPATECLSTWALARAVASELAGSALVQDHCRDLFGRPLVVYLGALPPSAGVRLPYALVTPSEEEHGRSGVGHVVDVALAIDAGAEENTAEPRALDGARGVLVVGRGDALQSLVDDIRVHFDDALPGSVQTDFDVAFDTWAAYPTQSARLSLRFEDETAFKDL